MVGHYLLQDLSALHYQSDAYRASLWSRWASYQSMNFQDLALPLCEIYQNQTELPQVER